MMTLSWSVSATAKPKKKNLKTKIKGACQKIKKRKLKAQDSDKEIPILKNGISLKVKIFLIICNLK